MRPSVRELKGVEKTRAEEGAAAKKILDLADEEGRDPTPEENEIVTGHLKAITNLNEREKELKARIETEDRARKYGEKDGEENKGVPLQNGIGSVQPQPQRLSPGELFVNSDQYKNIRARIQESGAVPQFDTGAIALDLKGTLLEGTGSPGTGTGGGLLQVPDVVPGATETLFQRLTVRDLIASGTTNTNSIRYTIEGTATSAAAGVAEGAAKPESTLGLSTTDEPVKKVATSLTVSDELLEDNAQVSSYINGRLSLFVAIEEERQIVRGAGTNELVGITGRSGVTTWARGTVDSNAVALFKAMNGQRGSSFLEPEAIIMNPTNWQTTRLGTDSAGQFFGGGPFLGPYGGPQGPVGQSGQVTGAIDSIWGKPVVVTTAIGAGTALVGAFSAAAQLFARGGRTVEASNSHSDYFEKNLVKIRAEERLALAVYRPAAFTLVSGLA